MSRGEDLYQLQCLDREGEGKRRRLAEVESEMADTSDLEQARQRLSQATVVARRSTAHQTDLELALQGLVDRIAREEKRLYGGTVRNPKQLEELQQEIASLQRRQAKLEDDLLIAMIEGEEVESRLREAGELLEASETGHRARQTELGAERIALDLRLAEISTERTALMPGISAADLADYDSLRRRKGGLAVAQVRSDTCTVCGVAVSANRRWHLREGDLVHCGNCERIVVLV